jgi:hypothetical protein
MILLGDHHGTAEIPAFVASVVATAAAAQPVVLALEAPRQDLPGLDAFLASDGERPALDRMLRDPFWQFPFQDGRRSVAMLELIRTLHELRARGARIEIVPFDAGPGDVRAGDRGGREQHMASALIALRNARPDAAIVVYAGRLHTMRQGVSRQSGEPLMANRLAAAGVRFVTLAPHYADGSAWVCRRSPATSCGPSFEKGIEPATGLRLEASADGNFDGWFGVGAITASPPAAFPEQAKGLTARLAAIRANAPALRRAASAYDAKDYKACAAEYASMTDPSGENAYDHACCLALQEERDAAFERLQYAVDRGYVALPDLTYDSDLASLREDARWPPKPRAAP